MAQLTFVLEEGKGYKASAIVNSDFNLHIEKDQPGLIQVYISTVESGLKSKVSELYEQYDVVDCDFDGIVYPKYVDVYSTVPVNKGIITEVI